jgi:hypothetical protein
MDQAASTDQSFFRHLRERGQGANLVGRVNVLVAIVKKRLSVKASLYEMLQILSLTLFEKTHILQLFSDIPAQTSLSDTDNQLNLFN